MKQLLQYLQPKGRLPDLVQTKHGKQLLIVGSAACVWDDVQALDVGRYEVAAVNDMMMHWPWGQRLDHGATLHPEKLPGWAFFQQYQAEKNNWNPMLVHALQDKPGVTHVWPIQRSGGNSGLFMVFIALLMGYDNIVLAGVPCDDTPRYFDPPWRPHKQLGKVTVLQEWERAAATVFNGRVQSMSGRTRALLGEP